MAEDLTARLVAVAEGLYAGSAEEFTDARNAVAKASKEDKELAAAVKKLKKPSVAAWAVNLLVRRESAQIDSVLALADSLRAAAEALDGDELRALTRQRRQLTTALASTARSLAREAGVRLTGPVLDQVEGTLTAAMLDPVAAQVVRTGRVLTAFTSTGVSEVDVAAVVAVPDALDVQAEPVDPVGEEPDEHEASGPDLRVVSDRAARLEAAQDSLAEATHRVKEAELELHEVESSVEHLNARRLQLQGEADELRRRIAAIEEDVDDVDDAIEEADAAREDAIGVLDEARSTQQSARAEVERLGS